MFWKHKLQILLVWIGLSGVAVGIVYHLQTYYKAEAIVLVDTQKIPDKYVMPTVNTALEDRVMTLKQQVLSYDSLQKIIDKFGLYRGEQKSSSQEEILERMTKDTEVELEKGWTRNQPGAFKVTYEGSDPRVVAEVTHEIAMRFVDQNIESREKRATQTSQFLSDQLEQARNDLGVQEKKVSEYKLHHNGELPEQENSLGAILSRLQLELQGNQDAINRAQQEKLMLENSIGVAESTIAGMMSVAEQSGGDRANSSDPTAQRAPKESEILQAKLDALRLRYSEDYPEIKRLRAEIEELRASEVRTESEAPKRAPAQVPSSASAASGASLSPKVPLRLPPDLADKLVKERERLATLRASLAVANRELEVRSAERTKILANIEVYENRLERLPLRQQEMTAITRDYEISKEHYQRLLDNKISAEMAAEMEQQQQAERFMLLQDARVPEVPSKPIRPLWISVGVVASLLISGLAAGLRELRRGTLLGEWELPAEVMVLGRVPWIAVKKDGFETSAAPGTGSWLQRKWRHALVVSVVLTLACGIAAVLYRAWNF